MAIFMAIQEVLILTDVVEVNLEPKVVVINIDTSLVIVVDINLEPTVVVVTL